MCSLARIQKKSDKVTINEKSENYGCYCFFAKLISHVTIKLCKSNINIHRGDIHSNQMRLYLFCSNVGDGYCIKFLDSIMAKKYVKPQILPCSKVWRGQANCLALGRSTIMNCLNVHNNMFLCTNIYLLLNYNITL